jgi:phosphotransferase system HPr (HPr) family protein
MSRTIEAIMRHMTVPSNGTIHQRNGTKKLEREFIDGKSILDLMTLAPSEGSTVRVSAEGPDAIEAIHAVGQLVRSRIDKD